MGSRKTRSNRVAAASRSAVAAFGLLALLACDPVWRASGAVVQAPPASAEPRPAAAGAVTNDDHPVAGAVVQIQCPSGYNRRATTDDSGHFKLVETGYVPKSCTVDVSAPGFAPRRWLVGELCVYEWDEASCSILGIRAELQRLPAGAPPPAAAPPPPSAAAAPVAPSTAPAAPSAAPAAPSAAPVAPASPAAPAGSSAVPAPSPPH